MSLQKIDPCLARIMFPVSSETKCFNCGSNENIVSMILAFDPVWTCAKCYYCCSILKKGKNKGGPCLNLKGKCARHK